MRIYRDPATGAIVTTDCAISGGGWEEVKASPANKSAATDAKPTEKVAKKRKDE